MSRYVPLLRLAAGELSDVYLGTLRSAEGFERPVVLKRAFAGLSGNAAEARDALVNEAQAALRLSHPHVVGAMELAELPEGLVLVFDYVPGISLHGLIAQLRRDGAALPWPVACRLIADACEGLDYAQRTLGRAHGDVSARNIIVTDEGFGRVIDFAPSDQRLTPIYTSPERAAGAGPSEGSDVYSLGLVLYALVNGEPAFQHETPEATLRHIAEGPSPEVSGPPVFRDLCAHLLRRASAHRPRLEEAATWLSDAAGSEGNRRNVRQLLQAEAGALLKARRQRVYAVLAGQQRSATLRTDTRTMAALEMFFEGSLPELDGTYVQR